MQKNIPNHAIWRVNGRRSTCRTTVVARSKRGLAMVIGAGKAPPPGSLLVPEADAVTGIRETHYQATVSRVERITETIDLITATYVRPRAI